MRILVLGAGGVGGYFGARFVQGGTDVTFLVRENRQKQLVDGLKVASPLGDFTIPVKTIVASDHTDPFDIIVVACKSYGLAGAMDAIAPHVRERTVILPFLNGLSHMNLIEERFPTALVWGGVAHIAAMLEDDGTIRQFTDVHTLIVGNRNGQEASDELVDSFVAGAAAAGVNAIRSRSIEQDLWDKWIFLTALAGGTCTMRADIGTILQADNGQAFLHGLFDECVAVADNAERRPTQEALEFYRDFLSGSYPNLTASMLRDMEHGGPTEADHIVGDMVRHARDAGVATPCLEVAWTHLQCYETARQVGDN